MKISFEKNGNGKFIDENVEKMCVTTTEIKAANAFAKVTGLSEDEHIDMLHLREKCVYVSFPIKDKKGKTTGYKTEPVIIIKNEENEVFLVDKENNEYDVEDTDVAFTERDRSENYSYVLTARLFFIGELETLAEKTVYVLDAIRETNESLKFIEME